MTDTSAEIRELHRRLLLERSGEERVRMAVSMCESARAIVWASIPDTLTLAQRRVEFLKRYYSSDLDPSWLESVIARIGDGGR